MKIEWKPGETRTDGKYVWLISVTPDVKNAKPIAFFAQSFDIQRSKWILRGVPKRVPVLESVTAERVVADECEWFHYKQDFMLPVWVLTDVLKPLYLRLETQVQRTEGGKLGANLIAEGRKK